MSTTKQIRDTKARDGGVCVLNLNGCTKVATTAHHRANRGSGGSKILDNLANLVATCVICNGTAEDDADVRADLIRRGLRVEKAATNEATLLRALLTPVVYPDGSEWWLTRDGRRTADTTPEF